MYTAGYLSFFMDTLDFPEESRAPLTAELEKLLAAEGVHPLLEQAGDALFGDKEWREDIAPLLQEASKKSSVHTHTVDLLFLIAESEKLRENYKTAGVSEEIFWNTMADLKYKLLECYNVYGIWGTFVAWWHPWFFTMKRFALGRLQFEAVPFWGKEPVTVAGHTVNPGDTVINMHIPSAGPLKKEYRVDAYKRAYAFYEKEQTDGLLVFACESWLLYPPYREILSPTSNIVSFMDDFHIFKVDQYEFYDNWRVFGADHNKPAAELPEDTSMRRGFKRWLMADKKCGGGEGLFLYDGERFMK